MEEQEMRKGFYFSMDVVMALLIMSASMVFVLQLSSSSSSDFRTDSSRFQQLSTNTRDAMRLAEVEKVSSLDKSFTDTLRPTIGDQDMNKSVLNGISLLWANGNRSKARELARRYFSSRIADRYDFMLKFIEGGDSYVIYNSSRLKGNPRIVTSSSSLVSGHKINRSSNAYRSRALLSSVTKNKTRTVFFGGFVGQGQLFYNVTMNDLEKVRRVNLEGDFSGPFELYFNGQPAGNYTPEGGKLSADVFNVCTDQTNKSRCKALRPGYNNISFKFTGENKSIRGGLMEINYRRNYQLNSRSGKYLSKEKRIPGIDGIINYYSSFYVPGSLKGVKAHIHYSTQNRTLFVKAGNSTIYKNKTVGEVSKTISNQTIFNDFQQKNMSYKGISRRTVPFRIGLSNIKTKVIIGAIADAVSVVDVSGSMGCGWFQRPPCKIDKAQNASKTFVDIILNASGNRAGFVSYNQDIVDAHNLTKNDKSLKQMINSQTAGGNTCIGCGILRAIKVLDDRYVKHIFSRGSEWKYTTNYLNSTPDKNNGVNWTSPDYDTQAWNNGSAIIGTTPRSQTKLNKSNGSVYLRKTFYMKSPIYKNVSLKVLSNDAAKIYLNGKVIDNDTSRHAGKYWNREIDADGGLIRRGDNILGVKLKNRPYDTRHWTKDGSSEWNQGSFSGTRERSGGLELDTTSYTGTKQDVNAGNYCSVSGTTSSWAGSWFWRYRYSTYMDSVSINGINRNSGDNGGYLDATNSISDVMVPGRNYTIDVSFYTGGNNDYATVAFDWDGDGSIADQTAHEIGSCGTNGCTVSTEVHVPRSAASGSTLMRVMGEEGSYHTATCEDPNLNEVEDYSVYVGRPAYGNGSYMSQQFDAGMKANWSNVQIQNSTPSGTSFNVNYSDGNQWYDSISQVPNSQKLRYNVSMDTQDQFNTPRLDSIDVRYRVNKSAAEFDATLNLTQKRKKSMIVMSDGTPNVKTSMQNVPDHNNDGTVDAYDHTIEAACRAYQNHDIKVYTVAFGSGADNQLMNRTAQCGGGKFYSAGTNELEQVFRNISNSILNASFVAQRINTANKNAQGRLYQDSYLSFNYTDKQNLKFGKIGLQLSSDRFGGNVSSPKQGSFYVPNGSTVKSARVTSYSGIKWTDRALINNSGNFQYFYNLSNYGNDYPSLGDPFILNIPEKKLINGNNTVRIDTALKPSNPSGASPDNRFYYTLQAPSSVGYGGFFPNETAAKKDAKNRLEDKLTLYGNKPIVDLNSSSFDYSQNILGNQPHLWGPANVKLVIWSEK
ncbi:MAG: GEVED domain-containing protein [Candidatus Nanohalobium sp.]